MRKSTGLAIGEAKVAAKVTSEQAGALRNGKKTKLDFKKPSQILAYKCKHTWENQARKQFHSECN